MKIYAMKAVNKKVTPLGAQLKAMQKLLHMHLCVRIRAFIAKEELPRLDMFIEEWRKKEDVLRKAYEKECVCVCLCLCL